MSDDIQQDVKTATRMLAVRSGHIHMPGGCGIGMAALAFHLANRGFQVSVCDLTGGRIAAWLRKNNIQVDLGHAPSHLQNVDWVVQSSALSQDHAEIKAARAAGIPTLQRGAVLAALLQDYYSIIVSGTHGKTTTTAMITHALKAAGLNPSFCIGGESEALGGVAGIGESGIMVAEADESDGTLACYKPNIAVVLNVEFDHAEFYKDSESLNLCFETMLKTVRDTTIYCAEDPGAERLCGGGKNTLSYGFNSRANLYTSNYAATDIESKFDVNLNGKRLGKLSIPAVGPHNALNALAACAAALAAKASFKDIAAGLSGFKNVRRRFERLIDNEEIMVVSDYAHHPSEVAALMSSARLTKRSRLLAIFQPHRFSRTKKLGTDFPDSFEGIDELALVPVYAASEKPVAGGTMWDLYAHFRKAGGVKTSCAHSATQAWNHMRGVLKRGDGVLIVGAGNIVEIGERVKADLKSGIHRTENEIERRADEMSALGLTSTLIKTNESMAEKTTLRVGGKTDIFAEVGCESDLSRIMAWVASERIPARIIGAGSNILVSDHGFRGVVIRLMGENFNHIRQDPEGRIIAGGAVMLNVLIRRMAKLEKSGLLFMSGIPGTVGGALRMNAGAWGSSIGDRTAWVKILKRDGSVTIVEKEKLRFTYRECELLRGCIALEAAFFVEQSRAEDIKCMLNSITVRRKWMPKTRSAGSVFKNPENEFAGRLIEQAGLKGFRVGGAHVSKAHGNFIVTEKGATASDVFALIGIIRNAVKINSGIFLSREIVSFE